MSDSIYNIGGIEHLGSSFGQSDFEFAWNMCESTGNCEYIDKGERFRNPFVWKKKYDNSYNEFIENIIFISFLLRKSSMKISTLNDMSNYDLMNGIVNEDRYRELEKPFGIMGNAVVKSVDVLTVVSNAIKNTVKRSKLQYDIHRTDENFALEKRDEMDRKAKAILKKQVVKNISELVGHDLSGIIEPEDDNVNSIEDILSIIKDKDELSVELSALIESCLNETGSKMQLDDCMHDKLAINCEVGRVVEHNGILSFERLDCLGVRELYGNGKDFESCMAVGYQEYITMSQVIEKNREVASLRKSAYDYIKRFTKENPDYSKRSGFISYYGMVLDSYKPDGSVSKFHFETKIIRYAYFEVLRNGKPIKKSDYIEFKKFNDNVSFYNEIGFVYSEKRLKSKRYIEFPIIDVWECVIYGLDTIISLKKVKSIVDNYGTYKVNSFSYVKKCEDAPSLITICSPIEWIISALYFKVQDSILRDKGLQEVVNLNRIANGINGVKEYNESQRATGQSFQQDNISGDGKSNSNGSVVNNLDTSVSVSNWMNTLSQAYRLMTFATGIPMEMLSSIPSSNGLGQSKIAIESSYLATYHYYSEHNEFVGMVLSTMLEKGLRVWTDKNKLKHLSLKGRKLFLSSKPYDEGSFELYISNFINDSEKKNLVNNIALKYMDRATSIEQLKGMIDVVSSDSVSQGLYVLEGIINEIKLAEDENRKNDYELRRQEVDGKLQVEKAARIEVPSAKIKADFEIEMAKLKVKEGVHSDNIAFKQDKVDMERFDNANKLIK